MDAATISITIKFLLKNSIRKLEMKFDFGKDADKDGGIFGLLGK